MHLRPAVNPLHAAGLMGVAAQDRSSLATTSKSDHILLPATSGAQDDDADVAAVCWDETVQLATHVEMHRTGREGAQPACANSLLPQPVSSSLTRHLLNKATAAACPHGCDGGGNSTGVGTTAGSCTSSRGSTGGSMNSQQRSTLGTHSSGRVTVQMQGWQWAVLQVLHKVRSLPMSSAAADAPGLIQACAALQSLLDEAEDQGHLQQWLGVPCMQMAQECAPGDEAACGSGLVGAASLRETLLTELVRLVDCPKADVLVKVGLSAVPTSAVCNPALRASFIS